MSQVNGDSLQQAKTRILIVDDERQNVKLLEVILRGQGYATEAAANGQEALDSVAKNPPDLILLDIKMPGLNGLDVAKALKSNPASCTIPIIMVTSMDDRDTRLNALQLGAEEYLTKPIDRIELWARVRNLLRLKEYSDLLAGHNRILDEQVKDRTKQLRDSYRETILTLTRAAEFRDEDTGTHVKRISHYNAEIARYLGMDNEFVDSIFYASPMHDVGKIGVPDHVLLKPSSLTPEELSIMRNHTSLGAEILKAKDSPYLKMGAEIALTHHEYWNGAGYPNGLKGEEIPLSGRIMNICDQYDALRMKRPYKPELDHETVVGILTRGDGRTLVEHFDPAIHAAFLDCADKFRGIYEEYWENSKVEWVSI